MPKVIKTGVDVSDFNASPDFRNDLIGRNSFRLAFEVQDDPVPQHHRGDRLEVFP